MFSHACTVYMPLNSWNTTPANGNYHLRCRDAPLCFGHFLVCSSLDAPLRPSCSSADSSSGLCCRAVAKVLSCVKIAAKSGNSELICHLKVINLPFKPKYAICNHFEDNLTHLDLRRVSYLVFHDPCLVGSHWFSQHVVSDLNAVFVSYIPVHVVSEKKWNIIHFHNLQVTPLCSLGEFYPIKSC